MWRSQYRNQGTHQTLVGNLVTDVNGSNLGGVQWYELRNSGGGWGLHQNGTHSPANVNRRMSSIAMDVDGNIHMGYSVSDGISTFPGIRTAGRLASDPLGTIPLAESVVVNGGGSQTAADRWGDYSSMNVNPSDQCTFWYANEFIPDGGGLWQTRIAPLKFVNDRTDTPIVPDTVSPVCQTVSVDPGPLLIAEGTIQDAGGLGRIEVLNSTNANVSIDPFDVGALDSVGVTITKNVEGNPLSLTIVGVDIAGNHQVCAP